MSGCVKKSRVRSGDFSSVVTHQDRVYAASWQDSAPSALYIYEFMKSWSEVKSFFVLRGWVTLSVTDHQITCCSSSESTIAVYSQRGQLLETYGTCGSGGIGQLHWPFITDSDGSVLIADCRKNRLQVMSEQGEFLTVQLQPPVSQPRCAVLFNSCLYVTSWSTNNIYQYT